jgi:flagellar biosynthesis protein FlhF
MRLRNFNAPDMRAAMQMVRDALGEDAVILSSQRVPGGKGVMVTAARDGDGGEEPVVTAADPSASLRESIAPIAKARAAAVGRGQELTLAELRRTLEFHNLHGEMADRLLENARRVELPSLNARDGLMAAMSALLRASFEFNPLPLEQESWRLLLVGPPGIGKTLTVSKIATQLAMKKKPVMVITTDNSRAGALEQLSAFTGILDVPLHEANNRDELKALLKKAPKTMRVIIDSAGANPYSFQEMRELGEYAGLPEIEPVLLAPAGGDCSEAEEIARAYSQLGIRKILVSRADMSRRLGGILTTAMVGELTFCNITGSPKVVDPCKPLSADVLAELLTKHRQEI